MPTIPYERIPHTQLAVARPDGQTWVDISEYLQSATTELGDVAAAGNGNSGGDNVVRRLDFTVINDKAQGVSGDSFQPRDKNSAWNNFDIDNDGAEEYAPLLWPTREVVLRIAIQEDPDGIRGAYNQESGTTQKIKEVLGAGDGIETSFPLKHGPVLMSKENPGQIDGHVYIDDVETTDYTVDYNSVPSVIHFNSPVPSGSIPTASYTYYHTLFAGYMGDNIQSSGHNISCTCRDYAKRLQDAYIDTTKEYGSEEGTPAETVIQQILTDQGLTDIDFYCPVPSEFMIFPYDVEYVSAWDATQDIADQMSWFLGFRWDSNTNKFRYTLMEPPRDKNSSNADYTLTARDDIYKMDLDINDKNIRNHFKITYRDKNTQERASVTVYDQDSIDEFWERPMQIEENKTSLIDTKEEALAFANSLKHDLKDMSGDAVIGMPIFPQVDLYTGINFDNPLLSSTVDFYGVDSVRHEIKIGENNSKFRTLAIASGKVCGAKTKWLVMETRPGAGKPVSFPEQSTTSPPPNVSNFAVSQDGLELVFAWTPITKEPVTYQIRSGESWETGQIVLNKIQGDSKRTKKILKGTNTYFIKAIDNFGNQSKAADESTVTVNFLPNVRDIIVSNEMQKEGSNLNYNDDFTGGNTYLVEVV